MSLVSGLEDVAVITLTLDGMAVAKRLEAELPARVTVYVSEKYDQLAPANWSRFPRRIYPLVDQIFSKHEALIFVMAAGIVVRAIAGHVQSKLHDPGVVVMDIQGQFAVALCSGHLGGSNELCRSIAEHLGAQAVITTGTDVNKTLAPDVLAKELGAKVDDWGPLKAVSGALVDSLPVGVYVEPGVQTPDLSVYARKKVQQVQDPAQLSAFRAAVVVSHRILPDPGVPTLWIRPPVLVLGVGCNRGTTQEEIAEAVDSHLQALGVSILSLREVTTLDKKSDEEGLRDFATRSAVPLTWYSPQAINAHAPPIPNPSEVVQRFVGVPGVAEAAALMASGAQELLLEKQKSGNLTLSVARILGPGVPPDGRWAPPLRVDRSADATGANR